MAMNPLFTVTFDAKPGGTNYRDFIAELRSKLGNRGHFSHRRPVLPPFDQTVPSRWWIHVVLQSQTSKVVTLAVRADNLYLEGFQSSDGTWWELTEGFILDAAYMGFRGGYGDLFHGTSYDGLANVPLGPKQMSDAINTLAARQRVATTGEAQKKAKEALLVLLLMLVEASRLVTVSEFVAELMHPRSGVQSGKIQEHMVAQVNGWQDLSKALLRTDARGVTLQGLMTEEKMEKMKVSTVEEVVAAVGILLFVPGPEKVDGGMTTAAAMQLFHGTN